MVRCRQPGHCVNALNRFRIAFDRLCSFSENANSFWNLDEEFYPTTNDLKNACTPSDALTEELPRRTSTYVNRTISRKILRHKKQNDFKRICSNAMAEENPTPRTEDTEEHMRQIARRFAQLPGKRLRRSWEAKTEAIEEKRSYMYEKIWSNQVG